MHEPAQPSRVVRFDAFELNLRTGELRKGGVKIRLQEQSFQILAALLERPGKLVTREVLEQRLWPTDTFVDFDKSLNIAISKLRQALGDSADEPRFIETLPRRGYRFIGVVEQLDETGEIVGLPAGTAAPGTISHYRLLEKLGEGGMGVVYKAEDTKLGRFVALKFLSPHLLKDEEAHKRFQREARAAAALNHPNICTVYEIDNADGQTFMALAFLDGQTLSAKIAAGPLQIPEALSLAMQLAEGLDAAHARDTFHRDLKPDNVMLLKGSRALAKILDFGLAHLAGSPKLTAERSRLGTISYMSPEQAQGAEVDRRSDIWSLGVILYEMVAGRPPFRSEFEQAVVYSIINEDPEPLTAVRTGVPLELERIVAKALSKKPEARYQHVDEMLVDLRALQEQGKVGKDQLRSGTTPARSFPAGRLAGKPLRYLAASAVLAALVWAITAWWASTREPAGSYGEGLTTVPFTSYPGAEDHATFSPDGSRVAFTWNGKEGNNYDIYVKEVGSDTTIRLTTDPATDSNPAWSPDGRLIAFRRETSPGVVQLALMPAVGGAQTILANVHAPVLGANVTRLSSRFASWCPESEHLVVSHSRAKDVPRGLFLISSKTRAQEQLTTAPPGSLGDEEPAFSADGHSLAFIRVARYDVRDIYLPDLDNDHRPLGEPRRLTTDYRRTFGPQWMPDGKTLLFASGGFVSSVLWTIPISGAVERTRVPVGTPASNPAISAAADRLVFTRGNFDTNVWKLNLERFDAPDTQPLVGSSTLLDRGAHYSPDGDRIVFVSNRAGTFGIWICDSDGSNPKPLFHDPNGAPSGSPRWSPDGRYIAFDSYADGNGNILIVSASGGEPFRLTTDTSDNVLPSWSHDGQSIYFASTRSGRYEIWKTRVGGGEAFQVTTNGGVVSQESPDGDYLYFTKDVGYLTSLWRTARGESTEQRILESIYLRNFDVTAGHLYYMFVPTLDRPEAYQIRSLDLQTGEHSTVASLALGVQPHLGLSISPDRKSLLYSRVDDFSADLLLVEGFQWGQRKPDPVSRSGR